MKKLLSLVFAAVMTVAAVSAQETYLGIRGIAQSSIGSELGSDFKDGFEYMGLNADAANEFSGGVAVFTRSVFDNGIGIQAEVGFTKNVMGLDISAGGVSVNDCSMSFNSLNIAALLCYDFHMNETFTLTPFAGLQSAIIIGDAEIEINGEPEKGSVDTTSVLSVVFGAGAAIKAGPGAVVIDARYNLGLNSIEEGNAEIAKFSSLAVSAGYQIKL